MKFTEITYKDLNGSRRRFTLPTVQNLSVPNEGKVPSKPTVTGQYRQQFTVDSPPQITFTVWLENGTYGGENVDVDRILNEFNHMKSNRLRFNMSTSHSAESKFLNDLVIESYTSQRASSNNRRLAVDVVCTQLQLADLKWEVVDNVDIFGYNIFAGPAEEDKESIVSFVVGNADEDLSLSVKDGFWAGLYHGARDLFTTGINATIQERIGAFINSPDNRIDDNRNGYYMRLGSPIDLRMGSATYRCKAQFLSQFQSESGSYTVRFPDITVEITETDSTKKLEPVVRGVYRSGAITRQGGADPFNYMMDVKSLYDFENTYRNFKSSSEEHLPKLADMNDYIRRNSPMITTDEAKINSGGIIFRYLPKDNRVVLTENITVDLDDLVEIMGYPIGEQFTCKYKMGNGEYVEVPLGTGFSITPSMFNHDSHFKVTAPGQYQEKWDTYFGSEYKIHVLAVTMGLKIQFYLFSPRVLDLGMVVR